MPRRSSCGGKVPRQRVEVAGRRTRLGRFQRKAQKFSESPGAGQGRINGGSRRNQTSNLGRKTHWRKAATRALSAGGAGNQTAGAHRFHENDTVMGWRKKSPKIPIAASGFPSSCKRERSP